MHATLTSKWERIVICLKRLSICMEHFFLFWKIIFAYRVLFYQARKLTTAMEEWVKKKLTDWGFKNIYNSIARIFIRGIIFQIEFEPVSLQTQIHFNVQTKVQFKIPRICIYYNYIYILVAIAIHRIVVSKNLYPSRSNMTFRNTSIAASPIIV